MKSFTLLTLTLLSVASAEKLIGKLKTLAHDVSGTVYAKDANTIVIKDFVYDGSGPDAFFWIGKSGSPKSTDEGTTYILGEEKNFAYRDTSAPVLRKYSKETVELTLPENFQMGDLKWFSVWCRQFSVDFGSLEFPANFQVGDDEIPSPIAPASSPEPEPESEPEVEPEAEAEAEAEPGYDHDSHGKAEPEPESGSSLVSATGAAILLAFGAAMLL